MKDLVGLEFRPTDDELVGYYLHNKIQGNTELVEWAINEVNICDFDPWNLRFQSKIKSKDRMWYFFSRRENNYATGNRQNRRTPSGKWKLTGDPTPVTDHLWTWCGIRGKIGHKRCLEFLDGRYPNKTKSDWVIHEYHNTVVLPEHRRTTYVICRLEYKGDDMSILSANAIDPSLSFVANMTNSGGSVVNQSRSYNTYSEDDSTNHGQHLNGYFNMLDQVPFSYEDYEVDPYTGQCLDELLLYEMTSMNENCNVCIPKKPVTGFFTDDSSNSDADSMFGSDNSSGTDGVGNLIEPNHTPIDDIPSLYTIMPSHNFEAREQPKLHLQGKEKVTNTQESECEWEMAEDSIKKLPSTKTVKQKWIVLEEISQRNSQCIYLKNMIIGFLLFISVIRWFILV